MNFQNKVKSDFYLIYTILWSTNKSEKMKSLSEVELRYGFPKSVKSHICPVIWSVLEFYQQLHCKIYL